MSHQSWVAVHKSFSAILLAMTSSSPNAENSGIASVGAAAAPALQQKPPVAPPASGAMAAIFKRAQDIRASFYPESTVGSESVCESDWEE